MSEEDAFQAAIDANPSDQANRLIFADWLEERGDERADGYRTMARLGKYADMNYLSRFVYAQHGHWVGGRDRSVLPRKWFIAIQKGKVWQTARWVAEGAVALAFAHLTDEDRSAIIKAQIKGAEPSQERCVCWDSGPDGILWRGCNLCNGTGWREKKPSKT